MSYAYEYDSLLIRAQASIFPKIILLDKGLVNKVVDNTVVISVVYSAEDMGVAKQLKTNIDNQYKVKLDNKLLIVKLIDFDVFDESDNSTSYIILTSTDSNILSVTKHASLSNKIVFSYNYTDFTNNCLISLLMKEKTYIYLNKSSLHQYGVDFVPLFYKIVKVVQ